MTGQQLTTFLKKNPVSTVCVLLSLVIAGIIYFRSDALETAENDLKEKTALGERYAANINHSSQLEEHYKALIAANKEIEDRFVLIPQLAQNLQYFYKLEADTGVKMTVTQNTQPAAAPVAGKKAPTPVSFAVSVQGDFASVIDFLRRVEEGAHFSRILSATIGASGVAGIDTGQARSISLSLNLELLGLP